LHPERGQIVEYGASGQNADVDRLPVRDGQDGDAQVELLFPQPHLRPAVLGEPLFGDVQPGHYFYARYDGGPEVPGRGRDAGFPQHAVHAVPDPEFVLIRLQVHVGGAFVDGVEQDLVHQLDDRCLLRLALLGEVPLFARDGLDREQIGFLIDQPLDRLGAHAVVRLRGLGYGGPGGQHGLDARFQNQGKLVDKFVVKRVVDGDRQATVAHREGNHSVALHDPGGHLGHGLGADLLGREVLEFHVQPLRQGLQELLLPHKPHLHEYLLRGATRGAGFAQDGGPSVGRKARQAALQHVHPAGVYPFMHTASPRERNIRQHLTKRARIHLRRTCTDTGPGGRRESVTCRVFPNPTSG